MNRRLAVCGAVFSIDVMVDGIPVSVRVMTIFEPRIHHCRIPEFECDHDFIEAHRFYSIPLQLTYTNCLFFR